MHAALGALAAAHGKTGAAANELERALAPHFAKEEEDALPPLGLLRSLASAQVPADARTVVQLAARLKEELPRMLEEHRAIVKALDALAEAARAEAHQAALSFVEKLKLHALTEEEVLYPAAILVGEYLSMKR